MWSRRMLMKFCIAAVLCGTAPLYAMAAGGKSLSCPAANPRPIMPDSVHGVVTRVQINPKMGRSMALSVHPGLQDQDPATWMRQIEEAGANIAELLLTPIDRLSPQGISGDDWKAYTEATLLPFSERTPAQQAKLKNIQDRIPGKNGVTAITAVQQNEILLEFLRRLERLKTAGEICGNVQFIVVERRWFPTADDPSNRRATEKRISSENVFANTIADFVNATAEEHLEHWLAGILFTEYTNTDMNQALPIILDVAARINSRTKNWLQSHILIAAGGGFGDQFNGIDKVTCPEDAKGPDSSYQFSCRAGRPLDFFPFISQQTGAFAFGYKFFNWKTAPTPLAYCATRRRDCALDNVTAAEWADYLSDSKRGLGFNDLATFVNRNAAVYPKAANVVFIGNSADSIFKMIEPSPDTEKGRLVAAPSLAALSGLFREASAKGGGWSGRLFMDAYGDRDRMTDKEHSAPDNGSYLFFVDRSPSDFTGNGKVSPATASQAFWRAWPALPNAN